MLDRYLDLAMSPDAPPAEIRDGAPRPETEIVLSMPAHLREGAMTRVPGTQATAEVFRRLIEGARRSVKIFSPYVDPTFTTYAQMAKAPIQVITTVRELRGRSVPVLERLSTTRPVAVRYLHEKQARSQIFQLHAKMLLADSSLAYIGSANFTDTSLHYNLELGVLSSDPALLAKLHALFDYFWDYGAKPSRP